MAKIIRNAQQDKKLIAIVASVFAVICIVIGISCILYYGQLKNTMRDESRDYMLEISNQMGTNVSKNVADNYSALDTISDSFSNADIKTFDELAAAVKSFKEHWKYSKIMLIDGNAKAYDETGSVVRLNGTDFLKSAAIDRKSALSVSEVIDGKESVVFAVPVEITIQNTRMLALAASYDLKSFDTILSMSAFDGKSFAHITDSSGGCLVRSSSENAFDFGINVVKFLEDSASDFVGAKLEDIRSELSGGKENFAEFKLGDIRWYMTYSPLEIASDVQIDVGGWRLMTFVPADAVNAKTNLLLNVTILMCVFIVWAFALLFAVLMFVTYRSKRRLERLAYVDDVTGGHTIKYFNELANKILQSSDKPNYTLVYTNIEKFKVLNEQYGRKNCDNLLRALSYCVSADLGADECMGRLTADNFCLLVKYEDEENLVRRIEGWKSVCNNYIEKNSMISLPFIIEFGVYVITNDTMPIAYMIDRAKLALSESSAQTHGNIKVAVYDEAVRKLLLREKQLEDMMDAALENGEFQVYLQPKFTTCSEKIGGAEALVRWQSKFEGLIYPDEFISLFEKNGFIMKLDICVFETVCKTIRRWLDEGLKPVKISVNCSRVNLKNQKFIDRYVEVSEKYSIPREYLELEFTENIVFGDVERFSTIIDKIHTAGFGCSMDDFGSGYSSLSMIQDIPVDTIKLDKIFFRSRSKASSSRSESVVGSIISMSKSLKMTTVAEGVEERSQVEMLKRLGCDLIQGYYFAKPMPIAQFETLAFGEKKNEEGKK